MAEPATVASDPELPFWLGWLLLSLGFGCVMTWLWVVGRVRRGKQVLRRKPRRSVPWGADGALLAMVYVVAAVWNYLLDQEAPERPETTLSFAAELLMVQLMLVATVVMWMVARWKATAIDFGIPKRLQDSITDLRWGALAFVAALGPVYLAQIVLVNLIELPSGHPEVMELMAGPNSEKLLALVLVAVVAAPLFEEFAFRVLLQGWLEKLGGKRAWWPVVASSVLFGLAHQGQGYAPVVLVILGLFLGYLYRQTHRLLPSVVLHALFNGLSLLTAWGISNAPGPG